MSELDRINAISRNVCQKHYDMRCHTRKMTRDRIVPKEKCTMCACKIILVGMHVQCKNFARKEGIEKYLVASKLHDLYGLRGELKFILVGQWYTLNEASKMTEYIEQRYGGWQGEKYETFN